MSSDEEVEQFEISEYDIENEFNPYRKRRKFTREDRIYGIWAEHDSDDDTRGKWGSKKADYSRPMQFVGGQVEQSDKEEGDKTSGDARVDESDSSDDEMARDEMVLERLADDDTKGKGNEAKLPSGFVSGKSGETNKLGMSKSTAKSSGQANRAKPMRQIDKKFGAWEKHTTGFGMKMLQKMGYKPGEGLGKEGEGIVKPIEAFKRRGRESLAFYGSEQKHEEYQKIGKEHTEKGKYVASEVEDQWRVDPAMKSKKKKKIKYTYKTVDDVLESGMKRGSLNMQTKSSVKIVDMTGPQERVLSGYDQLHNEPVVPDESSDSKIAGDEDQIFLPELMHNMNLLVDLAETEILDTNRQLQYERDQAITLAHEKRVVEEQIEKDTWQIERLEHVLSTIETCQERCQQDSTNPLTLTECATIFIDLKMNYPVEYKSYSLSSAAETFAFPLITKHLSQWLPLEKPQLCIEIFKQWKDILDDSRASVASSQRINNYERLVWNVWMPKVRSTVSLWSPRSCISMIEFIETWLPYLPAWITSNIFEQLIIPKLFAEVENWSPTADPVPIHSWIHPWLPFLGTRLEPLYAPIRHKLATALTAWHPSDPSARMILEPWKNVFSPGSMDVFLLRTIVPKLIICLNELTVSPQKQELEPFNYVMAWQGMISDHHFASLFEKHFFPKWMQVLCAWLSNSPNYDEVTRWYLGWKSMFNETLLNTPAIKTQFGIALDIMNRAVAAPGSVKQPGDRENVAYFTATERRKAEAAASMADKRVGQGQVGAPQTASTDSLRFIDLVQKIAEDSGVLFVPIHGRRHEGKQLYNIGKLTLYIDRSVIFISTSRDSWTPVSLDKLQQMIQ
ncbi:tuftelin-interacting protein 11-like [Corticium candelabrum]|uniref:tuftelin-interacting protein 11-like n=1 Tax=Corticium candelabrum TaxID=121492 RepID=UPI002E26E337|nr:tuftelin-interacting protein 11-like [Corticium candelabrum]